MNLRTEEPLFHKILPGALWLSVLSMWLTSCQTFSCGKDPEALIAKMEKLISEAENLGEAPGSDRWKPYDERFSHYYEDCYDALLPEMKGKQKRQFAKLAGRYITIRYGNSFFRKLFRGEKEEPAEEDMENFRDKLREIVGKGKELLGENRPAPPEIFGYPA